MALREIVMSGRCFEATTLPAVEMRYIDAPQWRKVGKGYQAYWPYSDALLEHLWQRVSDYYSSSFGFDDEDASRDRAAMLVWLNRYRHLMEPQQMAVPGGHPAVNP